MLKKSVLISAGVMWAAFSGATAVATESKNALLKDRAIGYVLTQRDWGIYQSAGALEECPNGESEWGPREQFKALFLQNGNKPTVEESELAQEGAIYFPTLEPDKFPYKEASGKIGYGLNLDGKIGPNDFTTPEGDKGIDNQLFRVIGCNDIFRGPTGIVYDISNQYLRSRNYNRLMIELTDVDSLVNDNDVTVTIYRGRDSLLMDGSGKNVIPGGTQRIDARWGKHFIQRLHGKIVDGVLITDTADVTIPYSESKPSEETYLSGHLKLNLTAERAEGVLGGYVRVDDWYMGINRNWATVFQSYGRNTAQSMYKKLRALADGYPDPKTGENTAISAAARLYFTQVFIEHPEKQVTAGHSASKKTDEVSR